MFTLNDQMIRANPFDSYPAGSLPAAEDALLFAAAVPVFAFVAVVLWIAGAMIHQQMKEPIR